MNFLFIIQGEGRGHISQAIALKEKLEVNGHRVPEILVGKSWHRPQPSLRELDPEGKARFFHSPNFLRTPDRKGIMPVLSILFNLFLFPVFVISIFRLRKYVQDKKTDAVVNFYDMIGGMAYRLTAQKKLYYVLSHHYFLESAYFRFPPGRDLSCGFLKLHNRICAPEGSHILALSFAPYEGYKNIRFVPPLLRKAVQQSSSGDSGFALVYLLNEGLLQSVVSLAENYPAQLFRVYCRQNLSQRNVPNNVELYEPDNDDFISDLSDCKLLITSAGFETQAEAAFLGKPVFTLPSKNHFEQECNAVDGEQHGISTALENFSGGLDVNPAIYNRFRKWIYKWDNDVIRWFDE